MNEQSRQARAEVVKALQNFNRLAGDLVLAQWGNAPAEELRSLDDAARAASAEASAAFARLVVARYNESENHSG